ncbi:MAG: hypothetical protein IAE82_04080 [Opitutaceae bacterium]|nr:hypothetical protein [Opitutaceae bacterium]
MPNMMTSMPGTPAMNMMMMPRCSMMMEKCAGGMMLTCTCDNTMSAGMMQNLCQMMGGGMISCVMMMNGMSMMTCNLAMGMCKCEMTKTGMCITCTSGDKACCDMIQACCDAMMAMMKGGCTCCVCMNGTPVCCGTC